MDTTSNMFPSQSHMLRHVAGLLWERAHGDADVADITDEIGLLVLCYEIPAWRMDQLARLFVGSDVHPMVIPMLDFVDACLHEETMDTEFGTAAI